MTDDADTTTVEFELIEVQRIDRGPIIATAHVCVILDGVEVVVQGLTVRRCKDGTADVSAPVYRCPRTGSWLPAVVLPQKLLDAIALEVLHAATGYRAQLVP